MAQTFKTATGTRRALVACGISLSEAIEACEALVEAAAGPELSKYIAERFEILARDVVDKIDGVAVSKVEVR